jgi:hypothetical protein
MSEHERIGYRGSAGSRGDLDDAQFSDALDVGIDNAGEVRANRAKLGVKRESGGPDPDLRSNWRRWIENNQGLVTLIGVFVAVVAVVIAIVAL